MLAHLVVFAVSLMLSFLVASNMQIRAEWLVGQYPILLVFVLVIKTVIFGLFKQYRGWWRYVGISDLTGIVRASLVSTMLIFGLWVAGLYIDPVRKGIPSVFDISQAVFVVDMFCTVLLLAGLRMAIRLYYEEFRTVESGRLKRFLIVGAGNTGESLLREIHRMTVAEYEVVGFIDDDPAKQGIQDTRYTCIGNCGAACGNLHGEKYRGGCHRNALGDGAAAQTSRAGLPGNKSPVQNRALDDGYRVGQIQGLADTRRGY